MSSIKKLSVIACLFFICCAGASAEQPPSFALFVSMVQQPQVLESQKEIDQLIDFAKKARVKILFVQIYRSNQSWFSSTLADSRLYENSLKNISCDPLALLIDKAHKQNIAVHAWLNLLSLGANKEAILLKKYGPEILTRNLDNKHTIEDYKIDNQYFLEPADSNVREALSRIVTEIVRSYPKLDGIQFDYIRYPDVHPHYGYTESNIKRFKQASGVSAIDDQSPAWKDWKRAQVTELLKILIDKARLVNPKIQISTTGCMPYSRAYAEAFQDWAMWVDSGLIDFVTVMNYSDNPQEFAQWNQAIKAKVKDFTKVKIGVGAYKFINAPSGFEEEFQSCQAHAYSCAIFHYGSVQASPLMRQFLEKE